MGTVANFLVFTSAGAISNVGANSIYAGNVGTNLGALNGFETLVVQPYGLFQSSPETSLCATDLDLLYNELNNRTADLQSAAAHEYGGTTITPGIYDNTGAISVTGNLTLDGQGNPNARFIIRSSGAFTIGAGSKIILTNGAEAKNVFWVIAGAVSLAATVEAKGIFINTKAISLDANCSLVGAVLSTSGAISTLDNMSLSSPFMLLKQNQTINIGTKPYDLLLINNSNAIQYWEAASDTNFTNPVHISQTSATLTGSCIGPLTASTFYRVIVLIDGVNVNSNTIKINVIPPPSLPDMGPTGAFALFTKAGAVSNGAGISINNAFIGTNSGAISGVYSRPLLLHQSDSKTLDCANYIQGLFDSVKAIPTKNNHVSALADGETILPGIYQINAAATLDGTLTLNGGRSTNAIFVVKISGAFAIAANSKIILTNGAIPSNVFWIIDGALSVGALCNLKGNFICQAGAIAIGNLSTSEGRIFTIAGAITLQNCTFSIPVVAKSNQLIASGTQPIDLYLEGYSDTVVKWQKSTDSNFSTPLDIPNSNNSTLSGTQVGALNSTTYFRAIVTIENTISYSTTATIAINKETIPLVVSGNQDYCSPTQPEDLVLSGNTATIIKWQSALDAIFTTPTDITNTTNTLTGTDIGILSVTTFFRAVVQNCAYPVAYSLSSKISISSTTWDGIAWNNGLPAIGKGVIFDSNYTANENVSACSITIKNGAAVAINDGFTLTVTNGINVLNGSLTFENNSSLIQINPSIINNDNITYKRESATVRPSDYTYWSSPVTNQTLAAAFPNSPSDRVFSFNAFSKPENYKRENILSTMTIGAGYIVQGPQNNSNTPPASYHAAFFGKPNNGLIEISIGPTDTSNLIGNPYPSAIDANLFLNVNSTILDGTIYFWTHASPLQLATEILNPGSGKYAYSADDYASYNLSGGVAAHAGETEPSGKIAAGQSFFTTSKATNAKIIFNNDMRISGGALGNDNSQFFKIKAAKVAMSPIIERDRIWLNLTNSKGAFKQALIGYITNATNDYNNSYDGESFDGNEYIDFYSINSNKKLVIQGRALPFDPSDEVSIGFKTTIAGDFKISIDHTDGLLVDQDVFIKDNLTNTLFNLKNGDYIFTTATGIFDTRFILLYTNKNLNTKDFNTQQNATLVSYKNREISIFSEVKTINKVLIYDLLGKRVYQNFSIDNNKLVIPYLGIGHQLLIIKTVLENNELITNKILY